MESWPQDPTVAFCLVLANNLADGRLVWSGMGDLYVVLFMEGQWYATGVAFVSSIVAGICFGVLMAAYHWWRKVVNNLPDWDSLG